MLNIEENIIEWENYLIIIRNYYFKKQWFWKFIWESNFEAINLPQKIWKVYIKMDKKDRNLYKDIISAKH